MKLLMFNVRLMHLGRKRLHLGAVGLTESFEVRLGLLPFSFILLIHGLSGFGSILCHLGTFMT